MPTVYSADRLTAVETRQAPWRGAQIGGVWAPGTATGLWPQSRDPIAFSEPDGWHLGGYSQACASYATIYATQPAVRTVVDAGARNIAQLGLHTYQRINDTDRRRVTAEPIAQIVSYPNPYTTQYRLVEHVLIDFFTFGNGFIVKLRRGEDDPPYELWRLPAVRVQAFGNLYPDYYGIYGYDGTWFEIPARDVIHFREANPGTDGIYGLSKIETLRRKLLEEAYAQGYRANYWRQGARLGGVIHRPLEAPEWTQEARDHFRQQFAEVYGGAQGAGRIPVLDEGMTFKDAAHTAEDQQLAEARELHDEEVARAYHIPAPIVGLLRRATFSNIREQHKMLYQDALGPTIQMVEQELELSLITEFAERASHYYEFNVREKLRGSFEEQVIALNTAVGRPWMTVNEARAVQNMPRSPHPADDAVAMPLNMTTSADVGDPASAFEEGAE